MQNIERLCMGCMNDNGGEEICPICSHKANTKNDPSFLPVKTWIKNRYLIGKVIENDGEGVTYIGWDNAENTIINIREFFPIPLSTRTEKGAIEVAEGNDYLYNTALMDFLQLHKTLMEVDLAAVSPITEIIECNNSAYVISRAPSGLVLREFLLRNGGSLSWDQAKGLFMPLISAIISLHQKGIIHGGISPETVYVGRDGKLRLAGFATAQLRQSGSSINAQLFPGCAAIEQYGTNRALSEATDVYGFAATLFRVLMGSTLPEASERVTDDKMSIPAETAKALPNAVLVSLANALQILFENRTQTMEEFKLDIAPAADATTGVVAAIPVKKSETAKPKTASDTKAKKLNSNRKYMLISAAITAAIFIVIGLLITLILDPFGNNNPSVQPSEMPSSEEVSSDESSEESEIPGLLLEVPDFSAKGMTFEEIVSEYPDFKFAVFGKKYSSKAPGIVVGQETKAGDKVEPGATIYLTISLGQESLVIPNIVGLSKEAATIELFKAGFLYHNITFYTIEDDSVPYGCVVKTDPAVSGYVNCDSAITVYISNVKTSEEPPVSSEEPTE